MNIKRRIPGSVILLLSVLFNACTSSRHDEAAGDVSVWITTGDKSSLLKESANKLFLTSEATSLPTIDIDPVQKFQEIDGFGYALTGGSAYLIRQKMDAKQREELLKELFLSDGKGIGVSYLRISIGSSDLDGYPFTYDDLHFGATDLPLAKFTLAEDEKNLIPLLKEILTINPDIKIMASPWSAPAWMKTNGKLKGGVLDPEYYEVYSRYLAMYIRAMAKAGIRIDAMTLQNEPENPKNNPSMLMTAQEQAIFVKENLGPVFRKDTIDTKIIVFDHNCDHPEYPIAVLDDRDTKKYVDGSAFHMYLGDIDALSKVHKAHPDKNIYFTEQWTSPHGDFSGDLRWHTKNLIIGATRNWSRNVLEWNLAADPSFNPHTNQGGCTECMGALTIGSTVTRNVSYYIIAQASKFVKPGSVRVASAGSSELANVAFVTPEGKRVAIVLNDREGAAEFAIRCSGKNTVASLPGKSVGTFIW